MTTRRATAIGFIAVLFWSLLALLTAATGTIPPFQLAAMTFLIGGLVGVASWIVRPKGFAGLRQKPAVWALGIAGLFGYHALYFAALRLAPPAESGLDQLPVAAADRAVLVAAAGRASAARASDRSVSRVCRRRGADRRTRRARCARRVFARLSLRLRGGIRVGGLFGAVAPLRRGADAMRSRASASRHRS